MRKTMEIVQNILVIAKRECYQDELKNKARISPQMFKDYVGKLVVKGLIKETRTTNRVNYITTTKGLKTLHKLKCANNTLNQIARYLGVR